MITREDWLKHCGFLGYIVRKLGWAKHICLIGGDKITSATKPTAPGCIPDYEPFPFRQRKKRRKVGPFSKRLSFAMLDLRRRRAATPGTSATASLRIWAARPMPRSRSYARCSH